MRKLILALPLAALASCATNTPNAIASAYAAYDTAATAEITYKASGKADPAIVAGIDNVRVPAFNALHAAEQVQITGGTPDMVAVGAAMSALTSYEAAHNIK